MHDHHFCSGMISCYSNTLLQGPFFIYQDGTQLSNDNFVTAVRQALQVTGFNISYFSGYSIRIWGSYYNCSGWFD